MTVVAHEDVIPQLAGHLGGVFEGSPDGVYIWLDEHHMTCNENLAKMFGLTVEEWSSGSTFAAETDMIPLAYGGHTVAYHFVRQVGE